MTEETIEVYAISTVDKIFKKITKDEIKLFLTQLIDMS